jgi:hypothetical protein
MIPRVCVVGGLVLVWMALVCAEVSALSEEPGNSCHAINS